MGRGIHEASKHSWIRKACLGVSSLDIEEIAHTCFSTLLELVCHPDLFIKYLEKGTTSGGLRKKLCVDLKATCAHVELQVFGLFGKLLTGPWMSNFYTSAETEINHIEGIELVRNIVGVLKEKKENAAGLLSSSWFFFWHKA